MHIHICHINIHIYMSYFKMSILNKVSSIFSYKYFTPLKSKCIYDMRKALSVSSCTGSLLVGCGTQNKYWIMIGELIRRDNHKLHPDLQSWVIIAYALQERYRWTQIFEMLSTMFHRAEGWKKAVSPSKLFSCLLFVTVKTLYKCFRLYVKMGYSINEWYFKKWELQSSF